MTLSHTRIWVAPTLAAIALVACGAGQARAQGTLKKKAEDAAHKVESAAHAAMPAHITRAVAVLHATKLGGEASGLVTFTKAEGGVHVVAEIRGLTPGLHGFHIHEFGDVSSPDAMSAGGHFNPEKAEHAGPDASRRHAGDLGNIEANESGVAKLDVVIPHMTFTGHDSVVGRGLIVHEKADDLKTQPTGNAGGRVLAGVIGVAKGS